LGRNRIEAADFVKNTMKSWKDTVEWFRDTDDDPTPAVARQLRKIIGVFHWLDDKVNRASGCPSSSLANSTAYTATGNSSAWHVGDKASLAAQWGQSVLYAQQVANLVPATLKAELTELANAGSRAQTQLLQSASPSSLITFEASYAQWQMFNSKLNALATVAIGRASGDAKSQLVTAQMQFSYIHEGTTTSTTAPSCCTAPAVNQKGANS
jgi:hypothetical protein